MKRTEKVRRPRRRCNEVNRPAGVETAVAEGREVTLPTTQNLLMEMYCVVLSPQQKRRSASVSVCQVRAGEGGKEETPPPPYQPLPGRQNSSGGSLSHSCT